jgi:hypothetical protein
MKTGAVPDMIDAKNLSDWNTRAFSGRVIAGERIGQ